MTDILDVKVTNDSFVFDFKDFQVETSKDYIDEVEGLGWHNNCLMIYVPGDIESIGLEHLMFGEAPFYTPCDFKLIGRESISREELKKYLNNIKSVRMIA